MKFQGRGKVYLSERDSTTGERGPTKVIICTDTLTLGLAEETFEHTNRCELVDAVDFRGSKSQSANLALTLSDLEDENFAVGVKGRQDQIGTPGTVTNEVIPGDDAVDGDFWFLGGNTPHHNITALVVTDSATSPATLVLNTDYEVDVFSGKVKFLDVSGLTQPFSFDYGYTDRAQVSFFTEASKEWWLTYDFKNKANAGAPGLVDLYKVQFSPFDNVDLQSEEIAIPTLNGTALVDPDKEDSDRLGRFGRRIL